MNIQNIIYINKSLMIEIKMHDALKFKIKQNYPLLKKIC